MAPKQGSIGSHYVETVCICRKHNQVLEFALDRLQDYIGIVTECVQYYQASCGQLGLEDFVKVSVK